MALVIQATAVRQLYYLFILYYYRSFSCFSEKIISKALSFRMMLFPPREAMTTAELPVAVMISAFRFLYPQQLSSVIGGPGGEAIVLSVYSV